MQFTPSVHSAHPPPSPHKGVSVAISNNSVWHRDSAGVQDKETGVAHGTGGLEAKLHRP